MNFKIKYGIWSGVIAVFFITGIIVYDQLPQARLLYQLYGKPEYMKVDPDRPIDDQVKIFEMAGRRFAMPLKYIDGQLNKGLVQDGVVLKYVLPDYRSLWDLNSKAEYTELFKSGFIAHTLLEPESSKPPLEISATNLLNSYSKHVLIEEKNDLEKYIGYRIKQNKLYPYDEFFLEKSNQKITGYIQCAVANRVPNPGCSYSFLNQGLRYSIYFNKEKFLADWKNQKKKAVNFIDSYETKVTNSPLGE